MGVTLKMVVEWHGPWAGRHAPTGAGRSLWDGRLGLGQPAGSRSSSVETEDEELAWVNGMAHGCVLGGLVKLAAP